jgi:glycosyltransferase involved in cell wall biosynthesis
LVAKFKPDVVVGFPINAIASTDGLASLPRVVVFGDLDHLIPRFRWRSTPVRPFARFGRATLAVLAARRQWEFSKLLLSRCNRVINLVPHHTRWLQEHGVPSCVHVRIPTVDLAGSEWKRRRQTVRSSRPRILMVGSLSGSATLPGLYLFAHEIIPAIEKSLGPNGFEVHIAGRHEPPADLRALLRRPSIVLRGYVDALTPEFLAADVVLVPTPIEIGIRVRIIVAASYGCCVVAHRANLMGTPEFEHDRDILAADDGRGLAEAVVHALTDAHLRERIGDAARRTYERYFGLDTAGRHLVAEVERAARTP